MALKSLGEDHASEDGAIMAEINITPLTDIFLVLLIIFMVTSSVMSQLGVNVQLPKSGAATSQTEESRPVLVTVLSDGRVAINGVPALMADVELKLRRSFQMNSSRTVVLEGDRKALLGAAVEVMDRAKKAGAENFAIATAPSEKN